MMLKLVSETSEFDINERVNRIRWVIRAIYRRLTKKHGKRYIDNVETKIDRARKLSKREKELYKLLLKLEDRQRTCVGQLSLAYRKELTDYDIFKLRASKPTIFMKNSKKHRNHRVPPRGRRW